MENDDRQTGHILTRRDTLKLLGVTSAALLAGCVPGLSGTAEPAGPATPGIAGTRAASLPACIVRPEETEGPYFVDEKLDRSDIRSDPSDGSLKEGLPLQLRFRVSQVKNNCAPLAGATVDVWHCDALGVYSDASDPGFNTRGKKFLRGYQVTDADGLVQFTTIYPGWYPGRTVHIHFKIRAGAGTGSVYDFTSQLFFEDAITDTVLAQPPYAARGERTLRNGGDGIFQNGGDQLLLDLVPVAEGYAATFDIGLQIP
jgi:protocatechuate 3,4-dioxygenase beta subunit